MTGTTDLLHWTDLITGDGKPAERGALITAHYTGTLADGTVFDSSHQRGRPFECVIGTGRVIRGWDVGILGGVYAEKIGLADQIDALEALQPMRVGGKRKLIVPAHLGYGARQMGKIVPHSELSFEIELLAVQTRDD